MDWANRARFPTESELLCQESRHCVERLKITGSLSVTRTDEKPSASSSRRNSCVLLLSDVSLKYRGTCVTTTSASPPVTSPLQ